MAQGHYTESVEEHVDLTSGGDNSDSTSSTAQAPFLLSGDTVFGPHYAPKRLSVSKERELNRQENFCGGEDVTDLGSKNRDIHVSGVLREDELVAFESLLDSKSVLDLTTHGWGGEVRVKSGEYEGPIGKDSQTRGYLFGYSLDLVSTGRDESDKHQPHSDPAHSPYDTNFTDSQLRRLENGQMTSL